MLARFISTTPIISLVRRLDSKANYLVPVLISACNLRTKLSDVSHVIIRCHSFTNINSTINEKLGSCMFPALIKSIVVEKKRVSPCHLRRHFFIHSCTCWIRDKVIYTCNVRRSWRSKWCWLKQAFGLPGRWVLSMDSISSCATFCTSLPRCRSFNGISSSSLAILYATADAEVNLTGRTSE